MTSSLKFEDLELNNAARVFSHKVKLHRVDNGLDGVKSLVQKSSSSLVETNRRHGKILKDMTAQFENFENKYRNSKRITKRPPPTPPTAKRLHTSSALLPKESPRGRNRARHSDCLSSEIENKALKEKIAELVKQNEHIRNQHDSFQQKILQENTTLTKDNKALVQKLSNEKLELQQTKRMKEVLQNRCEEEEKLRKEAIRDTQELQNCVTGLSTRVQQMRSEYDVLNAEKNKIIAQKEQCEHELRITLQDMKDSVSYTLKGEVMGQSDTIASLKSQLSQESLRLRQCSMENSQLKRRITKVEMESSEVVRHVSRNLAEAEVLHTRETEKKNEYKDRVQHLYLLVKELEQSKIDLKKTLSEERRRLIVAKKKESDLQNEVGDLREELAEMNAVTEGNAHIIKSLEEKCNTIMYTGEEIYSGDMHAKEQLVTDLKNQLRVVTHDAERRLDLQKKRQVFLAMRLNRLQQKSTTKDQHIRQLTSQLKRNSMELSTTGVATAHSLNPSQAPVGLFAASDCRNNGSPESSDIFSTIQAQENEKKSGKILFSAMESKCKILSQQNDTITLEVERLTTEKESFEQMSAVQKSEIKSLKSEIVSLKTKAHISIESIDRKREEVMNLVDRLSREKLNLKETLAAKQVEINDFKSREKLLANELALTKAKLEQANDNTDILEKTLTSWKEQHTSEFRDFARKRSSQNDMEDLTRKHEENILEMKKLHAATVHCMTEKHQNEMKQLIDTSEQTHAKSISEVQLLRTQLNQKASDIIGLEKELLLVSSKNETMTKNYETEAKVMKESFDEQISAFQMEIKRLQDMMEVKTADLEDMRRSNERAYRAAVTARVDKEHQLVVENSESLKAQQDLKSVTTKHEHLKECHRREITKLHSECDDLRGQLVEARKRYTEQQESNEHMQNQLTVTRKDMKDMQENYAKELSDAQENQLHLSNEIAEAKSTCEKQKATIISLKEGLAQAEKKSPTSTIGIITETEVNSEAEELKARIARLEGEHVIAIAETKTAMEKMYSEHINNLQSSVRLLRCNAQNAIEEQTKVNTQNLETELHKKVEELRVQESRIQTLTEEIEVANQISIDQVSSLKLDIEKKDTLLAEKKAELLQLEDALRTTKEEMSSSVNVIQDNLSKKAKEIAEKDFLIHSLNETVESLKEEIMEENATVKALESESQEKSESIDEKTAIIEQLSKDFDAIKNDHLKTQQSYSDVLIALEEKSYELETLGTEALKSIEQKDEEIESFKAKLQDTADKAFGAMKNELETKLAKKETTIQSLNEKLEKYNDKFEALRENHTVHIQRYEHRIESLKQEHNEKLSFIKTENEDIFSKTVSELSLKTEALSDANVKAKEEIESLREQIKNNGKLVDSLQLTVSESKKSYKTLEREKKNLEISMEATKYKMNEEFSVKLKEELGCLDKKHSMEKNALKKSLDHAESELEATTNSLETTLHQLNLTQVAVSEDVQKRHEAEKSSLKADHESKLDALNQEIMTRQSEFDESEAVLKVEIEALSQELDTVKNKLEISESERDKLTLEYDNSIRKHTKEIESFESTIGQSATDFIETEIAKTKKMEEDHCYAMKKLQNELDQCNTKVLIETEAKETISLKLEESFEKIRKMEEKMATQQSVYDAKYQEFEALEIKLTQLHKESQETVANLTTKLEDTCQLYTTEKMQKSALENDLKSIEESLVQRLVTENLLEEKLAENATVTVEHEEVLKKLKNEFETKAGEFREIILAKDDQIDNLNTSIAELEKSLKMTGTNNKEKEILLERRTQELTDQLNRYKEEAKAKNVDLSNLTQKCSELENNLKKAQSLHQSEVTILKDSHQKWIGSVVQSMEISGSALENDIRRLQSDRMKHLEEVYNGKVESIQQVLEMSKTEVEELKQINKNLLQEKQSLIENLGVSERETCEILKQKEDLKRKNSQMEQHLLEEKENSIKAVTSVKRSLGEEKQVELLALQSSYEEKLQAVNDSFVDKVKHIVEMMKAAHESQVNSVKKTVTERHEKILADRVARQEKYWRQFLRTKEVSFDEAFKSLQTKSVVVKKELERQVEALKKETAKQAVEQEKTLKQSLEWAASIEKLTETHKTEVEKHTLNLQTMSKKLEDVQGELIASTKETDKERLLRLEAIEKAEEEASKQSLKWTASFEMLTETHKTEIEKHALSAQTMSKNLEKLQHELKTLKEEADKERLLRLEAIENAKEEARIVRRKHKEEIDCSNDSHAKEIGQLQAELQMTTTRYEDRLRKAQKELEAKGMDLSKAADAKNELEKQSVIHAAQMSSLTAANQEKVANVSSQMEAQAREWNNKFVTQMKLVVNTIKDAHETHISQIVHEYNTKVSALEGEHQQTVVQLQDQVTLRQTELSTMTQKWLDTRHELTVLSEEIGVDKESVKDATLLFTVAEEIKGTSQEARYESEISTLKSEVENLKIAKKEAFDNYQSIFESMNLEFETKLTFLESRHKEEKYKLGMSHKRSIDKVTSQLKKFEKSQEDLNAAMNNQSNNSIDSFGEPVENKHQKELESLTQKYASEIEEMNQALHSKSSEIKRLEVAFSDVSSELTSSRNKWKRLMDERSRQVNEDEVERLKQKHVSHVQQLQTEFKSKTKNMECLYNETFEAVTIDLTRTKKELENVNNEWMNKLNENEELHSKLTSLTKLHEVEAQTLQTAYKKEIQSLRQAHEEELFRAQTAFQTEIKQLQIDFASKIPKAEKELSQTYEEKLNAMKASHISEMDKVEKDLELSLEQVNKVTKEYTKLVDAKKEADLEVQSWSRKYEVLKTSAEDKLQKVNADFEERLKVLKAQHDEQMKMLTAEDSVQIKKLNDLAAKLKQAEEDVLAKLAQQEAKHMASMQDMIAQKDLDAKKLVDAQEDSHAVAVKSLKMENEKLCISLTSSIEAIQASMGKVRDELTLQKSRHEEDVSTLKEQHASSCQELKDAFVSDLEKALQLERSKLEEEKRLHAAEVQELLLKLSEVKQGHDESVVNSSESLVNESVDSTMETSNISSRKSKIHYMEKIMKDRLRLRNENARLLAENATAREKLREFTAKSEAENRRHSMHSLGKLDVYSDKPMKSSDRRVTLGPATRRLTQHQRGKIKRNMSASVQKVLALQHRDTNTPTK